MMQKAVDLINIIVTDYEQGQIYTGKVISIKEFGAFLEFAPGKEGMVHISKIAKERINHVGRRSDTGRCCESCMPWKRQDGTHQLQH